MRFKPIVLIIGILFGVILFLPTVASASDDFLNIKSLQIIPGTEKSYINNKNFFKLEFIDDFTGLSIDLNKWMYVPSHWWQSDVLNIDGGYGIGMTKLNFKDFYYEGDFKMSTEKDFAEASLVFRAEDQGNLYMAQILPYSNSWKPNHFVIYSRRDNSFYGLAYIPIKKNIYKGEWYHFGIKAEDNQFEFYIDGDLQGKWTDENIEYLGAGFIGIRQFFTISSYDNIKIWSR